mgnify:CR=1 FL=1
MARRRELDRMVDLEAALDSAGFTAAAHYGDYTFDVDDYLELVRARARRNTLLAAIVICATLS